MMTNFLIIKNANDLLPNWGEFNYKSTVTPTTIISYMWSLRCMFCIFSRPPQKSCLNWRIELGGERDVVLNKLVLRKELWHYTKTAFLQYFSHVVTAASADSRLTGSVWHTHTSKLHSTEEFVMWTIGEHLEGMGRLVVPTPRLPWSWIW